MRFECKTIVWGCIAAAFSGLATQAAAQNQVYRCGNEYTNNVSRIKQGGCTPLSGGNLTIVRASTIRTSNMVRSPSTARRIPLTASDAATPRATVENSTQRTRDAGARSILQMELDKAGLRLAELQKEYNNGSPEKMGPETLNHQKYLDRVAELKSSIARTESDIAGIRRELGRTGG